MRFLSLVSLVALALALPSGSSWAQIVDPALSSIAEAKCTISPSGGGPNPAGFFAPSDDVRVDVVVVDLTGSPVAGSTVLCSSTAIGGAVVAWDNGPPDDEDPQTGVSNAAGAVAFIYDEGGVSIPAGGGGVPNLDFTVTAQGPGPGGPVVLPAGWTFSTSRSSPPTRASVAKARCP